MSMFGASTLAWTVFFLVFPSVLVSGGDEPFAFRHVEGEQWNLTVTVNEEVLVNGELFRRAEILNRIAVEVMEDGVLRNMTSIAEREPGSEVYRWAAEYDVSYRRDARGRFSDLPPASPVPPVRSIPTFPDRTLFPGETWTAPASEVHDLEPVFGVPHLLSLDFTVSYVYEGPTRLDGRNLHLIAIRYGYDWAADPAAVAVQRPEWGDFFPTELSGAFRQRLWWDQNAGRAYAAEDEFSITYWMNTGDSYTFKGLSEAQAVYTEAMDREALIQEIEEAVEEFGNAESVEEGVKLSLENVHFIPDSPRLLPGEDEKLTKIAEILSRHPVRDILVIGHTARVGTEESSQILSVERAQTVARFFLSLGIRDEEDILIRGMGSRQPVGDNSTESGRARNRRVEIIIMEN